MHCDPGTIFWRQKESKSNEKMQNTGPDGRKLAKVSDGRKDREEMGEGSSI